MQKSVKITELSVVIAGFGRSTPWPSDFNKTVRFIWHGCKLLSQNVYRKMEKLLDSDIREDQFGFRRTNSHYDLSQKIC